MEPQNKIDFDDFQGQSQLSQGNEQSYNSDLDDLPLSTICNFCMKEDQQFLDPEKNEMHLWKDCLMLITCEGCTQVVEIAEYDKHRQTDCKNHNLYKQCGSCQ